MFMSIMKKGSVSQINNLNMMHQYLDLGFDFRSKPKLIQNTDIVLLGICTKYDLEKYEIISLLNCNGFQQHLHFEELRGSSLIPDCSVK